jgi:hypothetical protein
MYWFQHSTGSHDDPDISDAWDELGDFGYVGFFVILEIYGQEFSHRNSEGFITISQTFLRRKLRKSSGKVQLLLNFFQKRNRILSKNENGKIMLNIPKYIGLASNWTKRLPTEVPTESPTSPIILEENRKENIIKEEDKNLLVPVSEKQKRVVNFKFSDDDFRLANLLSTLIGENIPNRKPPTPRELESWANDCRLMRERDGKTIPEIECLIRFCQDDLFWRNNILSIGKLRDQYTQLVGKMISEKSKKQQTKGVNYAEEWSDNLDKRVFPIDVE